MAKRQQFYQFGDTWSAGGFTLIDPSPIGKIILENFDIPSWPELYGQDDSETLLGFWVPLYQRWLDPTRSKVFFHEELNERPGIKLIKEQYKNRPVQVIKGQMIGPATLKWALLKHKLAMGNDEQIIKFISEAYVAQIQILSEVALSVVIALDEPAAFLVPECQELWKEFFHAIDMYKPFGVALHTCGGLVPHWLALPWQVVHFDVAEVIDHFEREPIVWAEAWQKYFTRGSWLAAGLIAANRMPLEPINEGLVKDFFEKFLPISNNQILFSTTCGIDCQTEAELNERLKYFNDLMSLAVSTKAPSEIKPGNLI
ncbi:MAG: hypothetical protein SGJ18_06205 [Pseudomonadota bacterium]|nr:hypothetical protein [Pseudomonadota bacterium]